MVLPYINMNPPQVYTCSPSWTLLPLRTIPLGRPSAPAPSIQYHALNLDWWFVSHMILYIFQCHSPKSSHPLPLSQSPKDCSIHMCLFCCLAYRLIVTIFLNSIRITADLSIETLQARKEWWDILKVMKENNLQPRLLYPDAKILHEWYKDRISHNSICSRLKFHFKV